MHFLFPEKALVQRLFSCVRQRTGTVAVYGYPIEG
jgi:hypothetical protein